MKRIDRNDIPLGEEAARRLLLARTGSRKDQADLAAWLKESPRHIEELLCAAAVSRTLESLPAQCWPDISAQLAGTPDNVIALDEPSTASRSHRPRWKARWWLSAAAAALLCIAGWWGLAQLQGRQSYSTAVGEQRTLTLDDGSLTYLNTRSEVRVHFTASAREIRLIDGEALFKVERDPARPFIVHTQDAVIRAIGTQFNVHRRATGTEVSVVEGIVDVSAGEGVVRLEAGQQARAQAGHARRLEGADVARSLTWQQRRLVFDLSPLAEVAAEFNRYNRSPRIRVEGLAAPAKRFSGVFDADDPRSLVKLLVTYGDLSVEWQGDEIVIRDRQGAAGGSAETAR